MEQEALVEEEFSVWRKNTLLLYDLVICHSLEWPSLTVQRLPSPPSSDGDEFSVHKLILGTHTSDDAPNFLMVADAYPPRDPTSAIVVDLENSVVPRVDIVQKIQVEGEVNRSRCMIQKPTVIAAKTNAPEVLCLIIRISRSIPVPDIFSSFFCESLSRLCPLVDSL